MADAKNWNKPNNEGSGSDASKQGTSGISGSQHGGTPGGTGGAGGQQSAGVAGTLGQVKDKAQDMIHNAGEKVQRWAQDAYGVSSEQVGQAADRVQQWAGDAYGVTAEHVKDFGQELTGFVRRNPIPALLIGFGVGMLIGRATRA